MLIEGFDDSVFIPFIILFVVFLVLMINFFRSFLEINQQNPQLHQDTSINDIIRIRNFINNLADQSETNDANNNSANIDELNRRTEQNRNRYNQITCPICLTTAVFPVETNCKHCFCSACIVQYWKHLTNGALHAKAKCPMCREMITCLLPLYSINEELQHQHTQNMSENFRLINMYNKRFSGLPKNLLEQILELPLYLRHIINELFSFNSLEIWMRIRFGFMFFIAILYFLSPLDIIPEALFGIFGLVDDLLVVLFIGLYVCMLYRQIISQR